jgi:TrkA domain protein
MRPIPGELLGAPRIVERLAALHEQIAGLTSEELVVAAGSPYVDRTLGDTQARSRTGASIVAVLRQQQVLPSPAPNFRFRAGDRVVVVGTPDAIEAVARILAG